MPRHTWTVRIELCETYDAVYAHAFLENGPVHLSGHGKALVGDITTTVSSRAAAARRSLADLSQAMLAAQEHPSTHVPAPPETEPAPAHLRAAPPPAPRPAPVSGSGPVGVHSMAPPATSIRGATFVPAVAG